ncbi:DMT family transporter [Prevotella sp.]|uniref:DMT family transporter n=1 Tax=Prevotella sp. TaxID=59823 RepID=UPI002F931DB3
MQYIGEFISIGVALSWTITAILSEYAGKRMGSIVLNMYRMLFALAFSFVFFWIVLGSPLPMPAGGNAYLWMMLSGVIGYVICDYCLMKCYIIIGSSYGQLFMTLAPVSAAITAWITLGQRLELKSILAMAVTLAGIGISILGRGANKRLAINLPLNGVIYALIAAVCQGIGLVVSKIGMNVYAEDMPADMMEAQPWILPFCANFFRCVAGLIGFSLLMMVSRHVDDFKQRRHDRRGMLAVALTTIFGPFAGVAFSLLAVQYTAAGIASTLMAMTPIFILPASHYIFHQPVTVRSVVGAVISVLGVSLFF